MDYSLNHNLPPKLLNRGLLFGESLFTTIKYDGQRLLYLEDHISRLKKGANYLYEIGEENTIWENIRAELKARKPSFKGPEAVRITLFKESTNFQLFDDDGKLEFVIHNRSLASQKIKRPLKMRLSSHLRQETLRPSFIKSCAYLDSLLELREAKKSGFEDILFLSSRGFITEASTSNIFSQKKGKIFTPKMSNFILDGITRKNLIKCIKENDLDFVEKDLSRNELLDMDEVWITNSTCGLRPVERLDDKLFTPIENEVSLYKKVEKLFQIYQEENNP